ncbi:MAG: septal ring lytic transglycosylase RlpA family protein [Burkholderiaceae bacterium]
MIASVSARACARLALAVSVGLAACSTSNRGAFYQDDGPGRGPPTDIARIPDAQPRDEPLRRAANRPYLVFGKRFTPMTERRPFKQRGEASWYGRKFHGRKTAIGERYDMYAMTAAHPTLPLPSFVRVTNLSNGRQVVVRVNDRGPFLNDRIIDLSWTAAAKLGYERDGHAQVEVELVMPGADAAPMVAAVAPETATNDAAGEPSAPVSAASSVDAERVDVVPAGATAVAAPQAGAGGERPADAANRVVVPAANVVLVNTDPQDAAVGVASDATQAGSGSTLQMETVVQGERLPARAPQGSSFSSARSSNATRPRPGRRSSPCAFPGSASALRFIRRISASRSSPGPTSPRSTPVPPWRACVPHRI